MWIVELFNYIDVLNIVSTEHQGQVPDNYREIVVYVCGCMYL